MDERLNYQICLLLCIAEILSTQIMGSILDDSEMRGMGLIGLVLLVIIFGLYAKECMK